MKLLVDKKIFGEVEHYIGSKEGQKRGNIHGHLLARIKEDPNCPLNHEWVERFLSARIPDLPSPDDLSPAADRQRRLHSIITREHMHDCNGESLSLS